VWRRTLRDYGLENRADHRPDQLSGGQRQRVAIARATIMQPAVILADEPTGNLDRATGEEVMRLLETLNGQGVTLIVVTHDGALGARARRQLLMEDGALQHDSAALKQTPARAHSRPDPLRPRRGDRQPPAHFPAGAGNGHRRRGGGRPHRARRRRPPLRAQ
jgi:ABC-type polar amino acid transport system ATPase subunit